MLNSESPYHNIHTDNIFVNKHSLEIITDSLEIIKKFDILGQYYVLSLKNLTLLHFLCIF